jgi:hypothetical protein
MHVYLVMRQSQIVHRRHGDHGKGFVDFKQVDIGHRPAGLGQQLAHGTHRRGGEQARLLRMGGVGHQAGQRLEPTAGGFAGRHQHQRGGTIGNGAGIGRRHRAVLAESRFQAGNLVQFCLERLLVNFHGLCAICLPPAPG